MDPHHKVIVIGAGVSGLVTLKTMQRLGIDCVVYEVNNYHGGLWHYNENAYGVMQFTHINVSRYNYAFSDFPFPEKGPEFAHHSAISDYIDSYVEHFNLAEDIQYNTRVISVTRSGSSETKDNWTMVCESEGGRFTSTCEYLVIATGHHAKPKIPQLPGEDNFEGEMIHSIKYKDVRLSGYEGKRVVIVGIGNSAVDIADNLVSKGRCPEVHISARTGAWVWPNYIFGYPAELYSSRVTLGDPSGIMKVVPKVILTLIQGNPDKWGLNPKYAPTDTHPTISPTLIHHIQRGAVRIAPDIKEIGSDSVRFVDGSTADDVDVIIKCTGYTIALPYLDEDVKTIICNEEANEVKMYHTVFSPEIGPSLAMIGYIQPIGGLITISEIQAQWLGMIITGHCTLPSKSEMEERIMQDKVGQAHYKDSTRHTIQRRPIAYCDKISSYFGAKPRFLDHPTLAHRLYFGSGGVAQWTLQGPYSNPEAAKQVRKVPIPPSNVLIPLFINGIIFFFLYQVIRLALFWL